MIGADSKIGDGDDNTPNQEMPEELNTGLTLVGKGSLIPGGLTIGRNVVIHAHADEKAFGRRKNIPSGATLGESLR